MDGRHNGRLAFIAVLSAPQQGSRGAFGIFENAGMRRGAAPPFACVARLGHQCMTVLYAFVKASVSHVTLLYIVCVQNAFTRAFPYWPQYCYLWVCRSKTHIRYLGYHDFIGWFSQRYFRKTWGGGGGIILMGTRFQGLNRPVLLPL